MEDTAIVDLYWQRSDSAISETDRKYACKKTPLTDEPVKVRIS